MGEIAWVRAATHGAGVGRPPAPPSGLPDATGDLLEPAMSIHQPAGRPRR
jgi:hypothetical protein